jgi:hypothetical protein
MSDAELSDARTMGSSERWVLVGVLGTATTFPAAFLVFFSRAAACLVSFFAAARASSSS